ncbi:MAG: ACP S-malonyltransferase [Phycisphaerales bacterium]
MPESARTAVALLCPGQGAQAIEMGMKWANASSSARSIITKADLILADEFDYPLSEIMWEGPKELLDRTDIAQPAIYVASVASWHALRQTGADWETAACAGLSLGEYTALHIAGVFDFETGLKLVAERGWLMQQAAEAQGGGMVALIGAEEADAQAICDEAGGDWVLVCANFNAPGQIVLSGRLDACKRAEELAVEHGFRAQALAVAGAFHSPLMKSAADGLEDALDDIEFQPPKVPVWSNVTGKPHDPENMELLKRRLVQQVVEPVRWSQGCLDMIAALRGEKTGENPDSESDVPAELPRATQSPTIHHQQVEFHELAPGSVLRGLMRRIDRNVKVTSHDEP